MVEFFRGKGKNNGIRVKGEKQRNSSGSKPIFFSEFL